MNRKRIALCCCAALVASGIGLNIQNAISNYGIGENSLSLVAVGTGSNSGSNSNSNSNTGPGNNSNAAYFVRTSAECGKNLSGKANATFRYSIEGHVSNKLDRFNGSGHCQVSVIHPNTTCDPGGGKTCTPVPCPKVTWYYSN